MLPKPRDINVILRKGIEMHCSDIHIATGAPPKCRVYGDLKEMPYDTMSTQDTMNLLNPLMDAYARTKLDSNGQWDMAYSIQGVSRFRVNIFKQKGAYSAVFRVLASTVPPAETLGLPLSVFELTKKRRGLILVVGVTGSGKSTTLASFVDVINKNMPKHIITLEEPIEYIHWHSKSIVSQREVGSDVASFNLGLEAALREDPDVIMVGEMRDETTMRTALLAAETGHLVLSTLHTMGAAETVERVVDTFPEKMQKQVRNQLATTLEAVIAQQLLPKKDGSGYVVAYELMYRNRKVQEFIRSGDVLGLEDYMQSVEADDEGMIRMDDCIFNLFESGVISQGTALAYAIDKKYLQSLIS